MTGSKHETLTDLQARARDLAAAIERYAKTFSSPPLWLRIAGAHALGLVDQLNEAAEAQGHRESEALTRA